MCSIEFPLQEHVIVSLVYDCYSRGVVTFRNFPNSTEADGSMTLSSSVQAIGRYSRDFPECEEEKLRDSHLVECHEVTSKAGCEAHGTKALQRPDAQQTPNGIEERSRDSFLQFRDEWVRNRARNILHAASVSFLLRRHGIPLMPRHLCDGFSAIRRI